MSLDIVQSIKSDKNKLTAEIARELLRYEPETGKLYWKLRDRKWFATKNAHGTWNSRYSGKEAFIIIHERGYKSGFIFKRPYRAHRIIWLIQKGSWPKDQIDHINGISDDNRWINLRDVDQFQNQKNAKRRITNSSGVTGINWHKHSKSWRAEIGTNNKKITLGYFKKFDDAVKVRKQAELEHGFHPNHGHKR